MTRYLAPAKKNSGQLKNEAVTAVENQESDDIFSDFCPD